MPYTVRDLQEAHRGRQVAGRDDPGRLCTPAGSRRSRAVHRAAAEGRSGRGGGERCDAGGRRPAAVRRPVRGQGQHRRRGPADHRRLPGLRLHARNARAFVVRRLVGRRRDRRSARPTSTSSPPAWSACARPTACRATRCGPTSSPAARAPARRCGRGRDRAVRARHRHGGLRPRAGGAQRHRRPEAEARRACRRAASCPPAARSTAISVFALTSRTPSRCFASPRASTRPTLFAAASRSASSAAPPRLADRRAARRAAEFFGDAEARARFRGRSRPARRLWARASWKSISSRSSPSRGCSTRGPGWRSATPRPSR